MRVDIIEPPVLNPVKITLDTQEEIDQLYALLDYSPIRTALNINKGSGWDDLHNYLADFKFKSEDYKKWESRLQGMNSLK